jgi:hypothetical protein
MMMVAIAADVVVDSRCYARADGPLCLLYGRFSMPPLARGFVVAAVEAGTGAALTSIEG